MFASLRIFKLWRRLFLHGYSVLQRKRIHGALRCDSHNAAESIWECEVAERKGLTLRFIDSKGVNKCRKLHH